MSKSIPLTQGKVAIVDDEDYERVSQFKWCVWRAHNLCYAMRRVPASHPATIWLHRFILDAPRGKHVDHISGDGLDNRRSNLRLCCHAENVRNQRKRKGSSRFKGVSWHKGTRKWTAKICTAYHRIELGYFSSEDDAYAAYCEASAKYHGEFGRTA